MNLPVPPLTPLTVTGLTDEIAYRLRIEILEGRLPLGARLQTEELAARFGVSRTPVREALRKLQALNLVEVTPNRGATVRIPSRAEVVEVYELRAELEGYACELAAERADDDELEELDRAQARLSEAIASAKSMTEASLDAAVTNWNDSFHTCIHRAASNRRLVRSIEELVHFFPRDAVWQAIGGDQAALTAMNIHEHEAITAALRARAASDARRAMHDHVRGAGEILLGYLDGKRFWG